MAESSDSDETFDPYRDVIGQSTSSSPEEEEYESAGEEPLSVYGTVFSRPSSVRTQPFSLDLDIDTDFEDEDRVGPLYVPTLQRPASERTAAGPFERILLQKSKSFEVSLRIDTEGQDPYCLLGYSFESQYSQPLRSTNISVLKSEFQRSPEIVYEDEMFASTIVGWSVHKYKPYFLSLTELGPDSHTVPLSDTIFPVFVMGWREEPVSRQVLDRSITLYKVGFYLALISNHKVVALPMKVHVYKHQHLYHYDVKTLRGRLNPCIVFMELDENTGKYVKRYRDFGKIDRILDRENTDVGIYGMYAGGPLIDASIDSPERNRVTWDQPLPTEYDSFGLSSMRGGFRYDIDCQQFSRRVGYLCAKNGLLIVKESRTWVLDMGEEVEEYAPLHRSLLKEQTFIICDGFNSYCLYYTMAAAMKKIPFKELSRNPLDPQIVIVPEGLSALNVCLNREDHNLRNAEYFNENPDISPLIIDWRRFQKDFGDILSFVPFGDDWQEESPQPAHEEAQPLQRPVMEVKQLMNLKDINDYIIYEIQFEQLSRLYLLSLSQEPNYFPSSKRYDEYWNVFCLLRPLDGRSDVDQLYYYLGTISNSHRTSARDKWHRYSYSATHFQKRLFPVDIDRRLYPFITEEEHQTARQMGWEWRNVMKNIDFKVVLKILPNTAQAQFGNQSTITVSRFQRLSQLSFAPIPKTVTKDSVN